MPSTRNENLTVALELTQRGWSVVPVCVLVAEVPRCCPQCGRKVPKGRVGRPPRQVAVEILVVAYERTGSVSAAAVELDIPSSTARDRLKAAGVLVTAGDRGRERKTSTSSTTQWAGHDRQRHAS